jgi:hypothetical protein
MKRRTFLKGMATAIAIGMAPAFLNKTSLEIIHTDTAKEQSVGIMSLWKIEKDGTKELISKKSIPIVDNGINSLRIIDYPRKHSVNAAFSKEGLRFAYPGEGQIDEVGFGSSNSYQRIILDKPITVKSDDYLEMEFRPPWGLRSRHLQSFELSPGTEWG